MQTESYDVAVVGGSAAGLSAALVLGRARRRVVVIDAGAPGSPAPAAGAANFRRASRSNRRMRSVSSPSGADTRPRERATRPDARVEALRPPVRRIDTRGSKGAESAPKG